VNGVAEEPRGAEYSEYMKMSWQPVVLFAGSLLTVFLLTGADQLSDQIAHKAPFEYTSSGQLKFPVDYREWVFLSSGEGMTYGPVGDMGRMGPPMFDNVFVNPASYRAFLKTGHWPDKTMFVLEVRTSESHASINHDGHFQTGVMGIEAEVKDSSVKGGTWTFYGFDDIKEPETAKAQPVGRDASCYSCHAKNTAVENTFAQFYPVLYNVAVKKGTLNPGFKPLPVNSGDLMDLIEKEGWPAGANALNAAAKDSPGASVLDQGELRMLGSMLQGRHPAEAASLLRWSTEKHPDSALLQASLSGAYAAAGDKESARSALMRARDLAASDASLTKAEREEINKAAAEGVK